MLAVAPLRDTTNDENHGCVSESAVNSFSFNPEEFPDFADGNLLESIDFDDLFVGINDGDVLPDLEMDSEILADFSASGGEESASEKTDEENNSQRPSGKEEGDKLSGSGSGEGSGKGDEIVNSKREGGKKAVPGKENEKGRKSSSAQAAKSSNSSSNQGKRKVKVDWTPELHRRFVQAVEQLGVDKAVPSRILELMGIDCLTRHNIASHLQKYRSHRKHLLAREAEAASWTQRRQMYGSAVAGGGGGKRSEMSPWVAPTMGFPPITPMHPHFRPLHVWGHPSIDQALHHIWPKHLAHSPPPPPAWLPPPPPSHPSFWHHHHHRAVPNGPSPGTPCFPQAIPATRFGAAAVAGIPSHQSHGVAVPTGHSLSGPHRPPFDFQPSKESIDAAIEDVLSKPWLPLPLGLKPPSTDSVMVELQRQGVPKVPPNPTSSSSSCATATAALS